MRNFIFLFLLLLFSTKFYAQDKIYTIDKQELNVKILEKNDKFVRYVYSGENPGTIFTMRTNRIEKIEFANGQIDYAGKQNPRRLKPFGINFGLLYSLWCCETGSLNFTFDYYILPQIELEVSARAVYEEPTIMLGSKFHLNRNWSTKRITPFTGLMIDAGGSYFEIPIGINYAGKSGFNAAISLNSFKYNIANTITKYDIYGEIKLGWRMSLRK